MYKMSFVLALAVLIMAGLVMALFSMAPGSQADQAQRAEASLDSNVPPSGPYRVNGQSSCVVQDLPDSRSVSGQWTTADCQSQVEGRGYARYYTFTVTEGQQVTINLESGHDTYLYLRRGSEVSGTVLHENDDITLGDLDSRISETLASGTYIVEATTYQPDLIGGFTLTVTGQVTGGSGLPASTPTPAPTPVPTQAPNPTAAPPTNSGACVQPLPASGSVNGRWAPGCESQEGSRGYARYYTFTLDQSANVTIDLESTIDTLLRLRAGDAISGNRYVDRNDDFGGSTNSRISRVLDIGTYTIEATTFDSGRAGIFRLTVAVGAGGDGSPPPTDPPTTDPPTTNPPATDPPADPTACVQPLPDSGFVTGQWADDCQSEVPSRGYARYYTFTVGQQEDIVIDLGSVWDTYLYLREGTATGGTHRASHDDISGGNRNSRISISLPSGTYTIEATTYAPDKEGVFTLTVTGLGSAPEAPAPEESGNCRVGQTLSPGQDCAHGNFTVLVQSNGSLSVNFDGATASPSGLNSTRSGNTWTINGLP